MSYLLEYSSTALRQLKKLEKPVQKRIIVALERSRIRPEAHFQRLVGEKVYRLRVGDYRVIADIINKQLVILVIKVGHRKKVYKKI